MDSFQAENARAWDSLARGKAPLARPATDADFAHPLATIDPAGWLGDSIRGWSVLCLAAGGGRQSALYAAAGANVTVLDISRQMLSQDVQVAHERKLQLRVVEGTMTDLSMFDAGEFDLVIQPVSTCYVPDVVEVYRQVARIVRGGGLYVSQHKTPTSLQCGIQPQADGYIVEQTYYRAEPLPLAVEPSRLREQGATEYLHRWEQLVGGLCRAGFVVEDLLEPLHAKHDAQPGAFGHRAQYIAPYVRIKARRRGNEQRLIH